MRRRKWIWNNSFGSICMKILLKLISLLWMQDNKCIVINWPLTTTFVVFRSVTDIIYFMHIILQVRTTYIPLIYLKLILGHYPLSSLSLLTIIIIWYESRSVTVSYFFGNSLLSLDVVLQNLFVIYEWLFAKMVNNCYNYLGLPTDASINVLPTQNHLAIGAGKVIFSRCRTSGQHILTCPFTTSHFGSHWRETFPTLLG